MSKNTAPLPDWELVLSSAARLQSILPEALLVGGTASAIYAERTIQFRQCFPDQEIASTLSTQLSWSHFIELLPIKDPLARDFYAEMRRIERWDSNEQEGQP